MLTKSHTADGIGGNCKKGLASHRGSFDYVQDDGVKARIKAEKSSGGGGIVGRAGDGGGKI